MTVLIEIGICLIIPILVAYSIVKITFGKRVEINFSRQKIYGWYDMDILCSSSFSRDMTYGEISNIKKELSEELERQIIKYKQIKKSQQCKDKKLNSKS